MARIMNGCSWHAQQLQHVLTLPEVYTTSTHLFNNDHNKSLPSLIWLWTQTNTPYRGSGNWDCSSKWATAFGWPLTQEQWVLEMMLRHYHVGHESQVSDLGTAVNSAYFNKCGPVNLAATLGWCLQLLHWGIKRVRSVQPKKACFSFTPSIFQQVWHEKQHPQLNKAQWRFVLRWPNVFLGSWGIGKCNNKSL